MDWNFSQYLLEGEDEHNFGRFVIDPLPRGMGNLIGNAIRRVVLSSVPGTAVIGMNFYGVVHEFSTVPGMYEDMPDFVLNIREIIFKLNGIDEATVRLEVKGEKEVKASDLILPAGVEVINPEHHICSLGADGDINVELYVRVGRGFIPEEENVEEELPVSTIYINSNFSPVKRAAYRVEVNENDESLERLIMDIRTNGSVNPAQALKISSVYLDKVLGVLDNVELKEIVTTQKKIEEHSSSESILDKPVSELGLSRRAGNCLRSGNINKISDLTNLSINELMCLKNLGKKSCDEIIEKLHDNGLTLREEESTGEE
jgi:DNA-directed RNA polymerase subunit alpha